ncbi:hypothetical protein ACFLY4_00545 [Chloroflexota bacterium]
MVQILFSHRLKDHFPQRYRFELSLFIFHTDLDTGEVEDLRVIAATDVGKAIKKLSTAASPAVQSRPFNIIPAG